MDIQMEPEGIQIYSDRRGLEFMLGQFISNAVKYCDKEPEIRIHVEKREENRKKMWILYIEDNGCGVKACDLPYILIKASPAVISMSARNQPAWGFILQERWRQIWD